MEEEKEETRRWVDRYSSLFAQVQSGLEPTDAEMEIFRRWFKETCE